MASPEMVGIRMMPADQVCPGCEEPIGLNKIAITDCFFAEGADQDLLILNLDTGGVHLHGATLMPLGQERLAPTLRRSLRGTSRRLRHMTRKPTTVAAAVLVVAATVGLRQVTRAVQS